MEKHGRKFTHKVSFYGVRCYWDDRGQWLLPVHRWLEPALWLAVCFHQYFVAPFKEDPAFPFKVLEEYRDEAE